MPDSNIAVVIGGSSGIGKAVSAELTRRNKSVLVGSRSSPSDLAPYSKSMMRPGVATWLPVDVTKDASVSAFFDTIANEHHLIETLFYCAGAGAVGAFPDVAPAVLEELTNVHFLGLYRSLYFSQKLVLHNSGTVIVIGSRAANFPITGMIAYGASKAAIAYLVRAVSPNFRAAGARITLINPGATDTPLRRKLFPNDQAELMAPEQVAAAAVALLQPEFANLHGSVIDLPW